MNYKFFLSLLISIVPSCVIAATLVAVYPLDRNTYAEGPDSGQFKYKDLPALICHKAQHVIGISETLAGFESDTLWALTDNGYGKAEHSADFIPRLYSLSLQNKAGITRAQYQGRYLALSDPDKHLSFSIQADYKHYYAQESLPLVPELIRQHRFLTGADIDPESIVIDTFGHLWIGDEYGPFLYQADRSGKLLRDVIELPQSIYSTQHPKLGSQSPVVKSSGGFEAMSISPDRHTLYVMLEKSLRQDAEHLLRLYSFDVAKQAYSKHYQIYQLDHAQNAVSAMAMLNAREILVLEDNLKLRPAKERVVQKIYQVNLNNDNQPLKKKLLLDLTKLDNPNSLQTMSATAKFIPIDEALEILDNRTLRLTNDNNGWGFAYIKIIHLNQDLSYTPAEAIKADLNWTSDSLTMNADSFDENRIYPQPFFKDNNLLGWLITSAYLALAISIQKKTSLFHKTHKSYIFWSCMCALMFLLFINKQLDLHALLIKSVKSHAIQHQWYSYRKFIQGIFTISIFTFILYAYSKNSQTIARLFKTNQKLAIGFVLLLIFFLLRLISINHLDQHFPFHKYFVTYEHFLEFTAQLIVLYGLYTNKQN